MTNSAETNWSCVEVNMFKMEKKLEQKPVNKPLVEYSVKPFISRYEIFVKFLFRSISRSRINRDITGCPSVCHTHTHKLTFFSEIGFANKHENYRIPNKNRFTMYSLINAKPRPKYFKCGSYQKYNFADTPEPKYTIYSTVFNFRVQKLS